MRGEEAQLGNGEKKVPTGGKFGKKKQNDGERGVRPPKKSRETPPRKQVARVELELGVKRKVRWEKKRHHHE